jgi:hypothetical protein
MMPLLVLAGLTGCAAKPEHVLVSSKDMEISLDSPEAERLWMAAQDTLRSNRYRLDRVDRRAGVITTFPELSQGLFEFWRHDVDTSRDLWESAINPLRRWAEVHFDAGDDGTLNRISLIVHKERLSAPDRQFNSTAAAYRLFSDTLPSTTGQYPAQSAEKGPFWIDLGRDPAMESYLLGRILDCTSPEEGEPPA